MRLLGRNQTVGPCERSKQAEQDLQHQLVRRIRFAAEQAGTLYESWVYEDGRPNRYAIDCTPVAFLPTTDAGQAVTLAAIRAIPILQAH